MLPKVRVFSSTIIRKHQSFSFFSIHFSLLQNKWPHTLNGTFISWFLSGRNLGTSSCELCSGLQGYYLVTTSLLPCNNQSICQPAVSSGSLTGKNLLWTHSECWQNFVLKTLSNDKSLPIFLYLSCSMYSVQFSHSVLSDSATPWTAARQASLSITNSQTLLKYVHWISDVI